MNKVYFYKIKNDNKGKKYKLEDGEYTIGHEESLDIVIEDSKIENTVLKVKSNKIQLVLMDDAIEKKIYRNISLNGEKLNKKETKYNINSKDEVSFKHTETRLKFKIKERNLSRSREKEIKQTQKQSDKTIENKNSVNSHIKSGIIWNSVEFGDEKKKDKFLKLMGAKKQKNLETFKSNLDLSQTAQISSTFSKINKDLEDQWLKTTGKR